MILVEDSNVEEDILVASDHEKKPKRRAVVASKSLLAVNAPQSPSRRLKAARPKTAKRRISNFRRYKQASIESYRRAPPKNSNEMRRFINRFIEGMDDEGISATLQNSLLQRFPQAVREAKKKKDQRFIVIESGLHWDDVCQVMDTAELPEDGD